jgi:hypothetical protein
MNISVMKATIWKGRLCLLRSESVRRTATQITLHDKIINKQVSLEVIL